MNIFKLSYKISRENPDIYKGYGFRHLNDVTKYYLHPNNESYSKTTSLCQPIGESLVLFTNLLNNLKEENKEPAKVNEFGITVSDKVLGNFYINSHKSNVFLEVFIPEDWKISGVFDPRISKINVLVKGNHIYISCFDKYNYFIEDSENSTRSLSKLHASFTALLAREIYQNRTFYMMISEYIEQPTFDLFVRLHEDFYQKYKYDEFLIDYQNLSYFNYDGYVDFAEFLKQNKLQPSLRLMKINRFDKSVFLKEFEQYIPKIADVKIPDELKNTCNAIHSGDFISVLFNGGNESSRSFSYNLVANELNIPVVSVIMCSSQLNDFVFGNYKVQSQIPVFSESNFTKAIKHGGAVVLENINYAPPEFVSKINLLLEQNGGIFLSTGEFVKRHQNFRLFATIGTTYRNINMFDAAVNAIPLTDEFAAKQLLLAVPECEENLSEILSVKHKLDILSEKAGIGFSMKHIESWVKLAKYEGYVISAEKTLVPMAGNNEDLKDLIKSIIFEHRW